MALSPRLAAAAGLCAGGGAGHCGGLDPPTPDVKVDVAGPPEPGSSPPPKPRSASARAPRGKRTAGEAVTRGLTVSETGTKAGYTLATVTRPTAGCVA